MCGVCVDCRCVEVNDIDSSRGQQLPQNDVCFVRFSFVLSLTLSQFLLLCFCRCVSPSRRTVYTPHYATDSRPVVKTVIQVHNSHY